jgi:REP element-mobilizing transposase RayT
MLPKRKNLRLKNYDYSQPGAYFVTICCQKRQPLFGEINDAGEMVLNGIGRMIVAWYLKIAEKFTRVQCDEFICMPDHVHMIIQILSTNDVNCRPPHGEAPTDTMTTSTKNDRGPTPLRRTP